MKLTDSIREISGIGPKRAEAFAEHGIRTIGDLLDFYPRKYLDRTVLGSLAFETKELVTLKVTVVKKGVLRRIRSNMTLFVLQIEELKEDGRVIKGEAVWFNQPYLRDVFGENETYYLFGKVTVKNKRHQIYNPQFAHESKLEDFFKIAPIYSKIEGVPNETLKKYMMSVFKNNWVDQDDLPERYLKKYNLLPKLEALKKIHFPESEEDVQTGRLKIKFEEALKINMGILNNRVVNGTSKIILEHYNVLRPFIKNLPFELTKSQLSVIDDIIDDLQKEIVINRLVQGDVGSGKTIIAVICAYLMALNGYQTAYMAPTEILAEQHAKNFRNYLEPYGIQVSLLTGSLKGKKRAEISKTIKNGEAQVIIGTHALIQDSIDYYNLGLVITDEQHRFGVKQRGKFSLKGEMPHTLVMSATPIPRTLALVLYGDLDVSYIDELPKGRKKIKTYFYNEKAYPKILNFMAGEMKKGHQAFLICPFIEESEEMSDVNDIQSVFEIIQKTYGQQFKIECLYSRMLSEDKKRIIADFNACKIDLLVATSIIEVGIDVPNVSVITILSAERFGLSQLHQLRGRVGRGKNQAYCFLVSNSRNDQTIERMRVIVNHHSGKLIADEDYRLRGPGDYFGLKQHGFPEFKTLNPYEDFDLIMETKKVAQEIYDSGEEELMVYKAKITASFYEDVMEISLN
ncbi:MAG: ATP-dependent DNA helicase RecG [Eubacterium sp.]